MSFLEWLLGEMSPNIEGPKFGIIQISLPLVVVCKEHGSHQVDDALMEHKAYYN